MKKTLFIIALFAGIIAKGQTTLDERVTQLKSVDFNLKLKIAMQQVAVGILTEPLSADPATAAVQVVKKSFAKNIVEYGGDKYVFPIIASGQVSETSSDLQILGAVSQMFSYFAAFKQEQ